MAGFRIKELTEDTVVDVLNNDGEKIGEQTITNITGYEIDFENMDSDLEKSLISEYLKYIAYLETWDGKLPSVITGENGTILIPMP